MAQVKAQYAELKEFNTIAKKIIEAQDEIFPSVDIDEFLKKIKAVVITNKDRKEGSDYFKVHTVKPPMSLFTEVTYVIELFQSDWDTMEDTTKEWIVFCAIRRIPTDSEDDGKVLGLDYKDDHLIAASVGVDWQLKDDLPKLTDPKSDIDWGNYGKEKDPVKALSDVVKDNVVENSTDN